MNHPYPRHTRVYVAENGLGTVDFYEYDNQGLVYNVILDSGRIIIASKDRVVLE